MKDYAPLEDLRILNFEIPTETPEEDGTFQWKSTTLVLVEVKSENTLGWGWTYANRATAELIRDHFQSSLVGKNVFDINDCWNLMNRSIRNLGRPGICSMAIAAVDNALWDLKAKLLKLSLVKLLGQSSESIPIYGSGGFTNYSLRQLEEQVQGWVEKGIRMIKIKVGRDLVNDINRVEFLRKLLGDNFEIFVDANGALTPQKALEFSNRIYHLGVTWFEEPVSSDDLQGLKYIRQKSPSGMAITAGEYGYDNFYFRRMLDAGAVDILQADATRCAGITGFLQAAQISEAYQIPLSSHTAPYLHLHPACSLRRFHSLEYFFDHARIEEMFFDISAVIKDGNMYPNLNYAGMGVVFNYDRARPYLVRDSGTN